MTGRTWTLLRVAFVVAAVAGAAWSWRASGGDVQQAAGTARIDGMLRDQLGRQVVKKVGFQ